MQQRFQKSNRLCFHSVEAREYLREGPGHQDTMRAFGLYQRDIRQNVSLIDAPWIHCTSKSVNFVKSDTPQLDRFNLTIAERKNKKYHRCIVFGTFKEEHNWSSFLK